MVEWPDSNAGSGRIFYRSRWKSQTSANFMSLPQFVKFHNLLQVVESFCGAKPARIRTLDRDSEGFSGAVVLRVVVQETPQAPEMEYCLRGWPPDSLPRERLLGLHRLLEHIHKCGVTPVPVPLRSKFGTTIFAEAGQFWQLEPWLPGVAFPKPVPAITALPTTPTLGQESGEPGRKPSAVDLLGDRVRIELTWREGDKEVRRDAEALFLNQESQTGKPQPGKWIYNGSRVENGMFFAQTSGSVISLITDQDALINSGAPGHDNDDVWAVNATNIPPFKTSVMVTILLPKKPETK